MKESLNQLSRFQDLQNLLLDTVQNSGFNNYNSQEDIEISPVGWHLLHCIYIEIYWIKEVILKKEKVPTVLENQANPFHSKKEKRGKNLPEFNYLIQWSRKKIVENRKLLLECIETKKTHPLVKNDFIIFFLNNHHAQHLESMRMGITARIKNKWKGSSDKSLHIESSKPGLPNIKVKEGFYIIGNEKEYFSYDNEKPSHSVYIRNFSISKEPVSNSEWKAFMEDGGYKKRELWTQVGWKWRETNNIFNPSHWLKCTNDKFVTASPSGINKPNGTDPVIGVSFHEARAFAKWNSCFLPHEYQWEISFKKLLKKNLVWEWCSNLFFPYPGFVPFPYRNYSIPSFDYQHHVLRGGSKYGEFEVTRRNFRNYHSTNRRNLFSGLRLAY